MVPRLLPPHSSIQPNRLLRPSRRARSTYPHPPHSKHHRSAHLHPPQPRHHIPHLAVQRYPPSPPNTPANISLPLLRSPIHQSPLVPTRNVHRISQTHSSRRTPPRHNPGNRVTSLRVQSEVATVTSQPHHQCTQDHLEFLHLSFAKSESTAIGPDDSIFFYLRTPSLRELHLSAQDLTPIMKSLSIHSTRNLHTLVLRPPGATHTWDREIVSKILEGVPCSKR
ncbi:hypothetical protein BDQ17DRAFT_477640 [Cyathus striatus]|nr:hypothetical protein BDQ17DRAFT_477640 [Cyathus striatus]